MLFGMQKKLVIGYYCIESIASSAFNCSKMANRNGEIPNYAMLPNDIFSVVVVDVNSSS